MYQGELLLLGGIVRQNNCVNHQDGSRVYAFPHRSFQEYLAAGELFDLPQSHQEAAVKAGDADWHDTLLFYAEYLREERDRLGLLLHALCPNKPLHCRWRRNSSVMRQCGTICELG